MGIIMNNAIVDVIREIQIDYLELLKNIAYTSENKVPPSLVDKVNIFWFKNKRIIGLAGNYLFKDKDTYCFSAATTFDVEDPDQNSFFLLGKYHIFDDPLPRYINEVNIINHSKNNLLIQSLNSRILNSIKDNIRIIEDYGDILWILPLSFISQIENQNYMDFHEISENLFCQFFVGISDKNDYQKKILTAKDIELNSDSNNISNVLLYDGDNPSDSWVDRIRGYRNETSEYISESFSDGDVFFVAVYGYVRQALAIIDMSNNFEVTPFIRTFTPLNYFLFLTKTINQNVERLNKNEFNFQIDFKALVSYLLYFEYCKRASQSSLSDLLRKADEIQFEKTLLHDLEIFQGDENIPKIVETINSHLDNLIGGAN